MDDFTRPFCIHVTAMTRQRVDMIPQEHTFRCLPSRLTEEWGTTRLPQSLNVHYISSWSIGAYRRYRWLLHSSTVWYMYAVRGKQIRSASFFLMMDSKRDTSPPTLSESSGWLVNLDPDIRDTVLNQDLIA
jgi:hypothetical protein